MDYNIPRALRSLLEETVQSYIYYPFDYHSCSYFDRFELFYLTDCQKLKDIIVKIYNIERDAYLKKCHDKQDEDILKEILSKRHLRINFNVVNRKITITIMAHFYERMREQIKTEVGDYIPIIESKLQSGYTGKVEFKFVNISDNARHIPRSIFSKYLIEDFKELITEYNNGNNKKIPANLVNSIQVETIKEVKHISLTL